MNSPPASCTPRLIRPLQGCNLNQEDAWLMPMGLSNGDEMDSSSGSEGREVSSYREDHDRSGLHVAALSPNPQPPQGEENSQRKGRKRRLHRHTAHQTQQMDAVFKEYESHDDRMQVGAMRNAVRPANCGNDPPSPRDASAEQQRLLCKNDRLREQVILGRNFLPEVERMATSPDVRDCISRVEVDESSSHPSGGGLIIYATIDINGVHSAMSPSDTSCIPLLRAGLRCPPGYASQKTRTERTPSLDASSSPWVFGSLREQWLPQSPTA